MTKPDCLVKSTLFTVMLVSSHFLCGQTDSLEYNHFATRSTMYGVGSTNVFDTYLSPQEYTGIEFRLSRENMRMTKIYDGNISAQNFFQAQVGYTRNRVDNNNTFNGLVNWNYGLHYQFRLTPGLKLLAGGLADLNGGFVYNLRNSNNPASAKAYINLAASGMAIWHFKVKNYPVILRYQVNLPFMGVMFSPKYGQSYYEIFTLGNHSGVVQFTSVHNQPSMRNMFTADLPAGRVKLRVGYYWDVQQSHINKLKTHTYSHVFMVGFVRNIYLINSKNESLIPAGHRAY